MGRGRSWKEELRKGFCVSLSVGEEVSSLVSVFDVFICFCMYGQILKVDELGLGMKSGYVFCVGKICEGGVGGMGIMALRTRGGIIICLEFCM